jgi:tRNA 2-thiouridine synthesizing protein A
MLAFHQRAMSPARCGRPRIGYHARAMTIRRETLDCRRLLCPMPVIRVQDRVAGLTPGDELTAVCTDPGALNDIPAWCRINGHQVLATETREAEYLVTLRVGPGCV